MSQNSIFILKSICALYRQIQTAKDRKISAYWKKYMTFTSLGTASQEFQFHYGEHEGRETLSELGEVAYLSSRHQREPFLQLHTFSELTDLMASLSV